jgi:hypothetical protein
MEVFAITCGGFWTHRFIRIAFATTLLRRNIPEVSGRSTLQFDIQLRIRSEALLESVVNSKGQAFDSKLLGGILM